ncbi:glycoside hydrolase family 3 protein [bacterium]|nr:glycoside hydrolase family 3 protein [bacterium]
MQVNDLTLRQKILQLFITGFNGENHRTNKYFVQMLEEGLGGAIFFTHNIKSELQTKKLTEEIIKDSLIPPFLSIDQEGGMVERTEKIYGGKKYLSAKSAYEMGLSFLQNQTKEIALELKKLGMNMNFSPVLDVNTNPNNPIIGERAFSSDVDEVINASKFAIKEYDKYGIIAVGKHFPGHGASDKDSHKTLPIINIEAKDLREHHIKPFEKAIEQNIPAIMVAHVLYPTLTDENVPASVSKKIITDLLINQLNFNGVIITDDMQMNGIKGFSRIDACIKALNAGITMFIFRDTTKDIYNLINEIELAIQNNLIDETIIDNAVQKNIDLKYRYGIIR